MIKIKRSTERSHHILIEKENLSETYSGKHLSRSLRYIKQPVGVVFGLSAFQKLLQCHIVVREQQCSSDFDGHYPWLKSFPRINVIRKATLTIQLREKRKGKRTSSKKKLLTDLLTDVIGGKLWKRLKDGAYFCYCAYVLRISRYSGFLWVVLTNTGIFLRGLKLCGENRT